MRQLVSVVTPEGIAYFEHDGETTTQIAQVVNRGLDVPEIITLGVNLGEALSLNGYAAAPAARVVESKQQREIGTAAEAEPPSTEKWEGRAECPECGKSYRRTSLKPHLVNVHRVPPTRATRLVREARALHDGDSVPRAKTGGGAAGRKRSTNAQMSERYPQISNESVIEYVRQHPDQSTRQIANGIMGEHADREALKAIANRIARQVEVGTFIARTVPGPHGVARLVKLSPTAQQRAVQAQAFPTHGLYGEAAASVALDGETHSIGESVAVDTQSETEPFPTLRWPGDPE